LFAAFRNVKTPVCKLPSELAVMTWWSVNSPTQIPTSPALTNEALGNGPQRFHYPQRNCCRTLLSRG
jgi:hypothetical protein